HTNLNEFMKHTILLFSFFMLAACMTANTTHAHEHSMMHDDRSTDGNHMKEHHDVTMEDISDRKDLMNETMTDRRDGMMKNFDEFKKTRVNGMMTIMKNRFEWAIDRLENIAGRME